MSHQGKVYCTKIYAKKKLPTFTSKKHISIKNEAEVETAIRNIYTFLYDQKFPEILKLSEKDFISDLQNKFEKVLKINNFKFKSKINDKTISEIEQKQYKNYLYEKYLLESEYKNYIKNPKKYKYLSNFQKHCDNSEKYAFHLCAPEVYGKFIQIFNNSSKNLDISYVLCINCKKCYKKNYIYMYCTYCQTNYYSCINNSENNKLPFATWKNYHCGAIINEIMKCIKCRNNLVYNKKENLLICLNNKCNFIGKPNDIIWKCVICGSDFNSNVKPYNPLEIKVYTNAIKYALLLKETAKPENINFCNNCGKNLNDCKFFHKFNCKGELYMSKLYDENVIICSKCHRINYYNKFIWTCPYCEKLIKNSIRTVSCFHSSTLSSSNDNFFLKDDKNSFSQKTSEKSSYYKFISEIFPRSNNSSIEKDKKSIFENGNSEDKTNKSTLKKNNSKSRKKTLFELINSRKEQNSSFNSNNSSIKNFTPSKQIYGNYNSDRNTLNTESQLTRMKNFYSRNSEKHPSPQKLYKLKINNIYIQNNNNKFITQSSYNNTIENSEDRQNYTDKVSNDSKIGRIFVKRSLYNFRNDKKMKKKDSNLHEKCNSNIIKYSKTTISKNFHSWSNILGTENNNNCYSNDKNQISKFNTCFSINEQKFNTLDKTDTNQFYLNDSLNKSSDYIANRILNKFGLNGISKNKSEKYSNNFPEKNNNPINKVSSFNIKNNKKIEINSSITKKKSSNIDSKIVYTKLKKFTKNDIIIKTNNENDKNDKNDKLNKKKIKKKVFFTEDKVNFVKKRNSNKLICTPEDIINISKESLIPIFDDLDYEFDFPIGEGTFGTIYSVKEISTGDYYALKKIICRDYQELQKFKQEVELCYSLQHNNIMKIYKIQFKYLDFTTYSINILMEKAMKDWEQEINERKKNKNYYTQKELVNILKQLLDALIFLQKKTIAHRDIKPQNILIFPNNIYKIADLGEAKDLGDTNTKFVSLKGCQLYMSPDLYIGLKKGEKNVNHNAYKSDIFSLGYCFLNAMSLGEEILIRIRDLNSKNEIIAAINKYVGKKLYDEKFKMLIYNMIELNQNKRYNYDKISIELQNL